MPEHLQYEFIKPCKRFYKWILQIAETLYKIYIIFAISYILFPQNLYIIFATKGEIKMYDIESLHESGKLPTRYYNQLNGKTAQENYNRGKARKKKKDESFIMYVIQNMLSATVKTALDEIFKGFKTRF